ncbi:LysR family transcriptional regulator [Mycobacterium paraseoulense]|uniref:LysR family transcriptional regulator n=1 Tax=Mycobacterium paraseoulense TaxID=590652 RepID=UPI0009F3FC0D|nr:LysR family transcriptional regulator [Mycobacterium paraseoulense]MCV7393686.1 LysR family transcriptional regulator [Mycobacterium paraseoulense]
MAHIVETAATVVQCVLHIATLPEPQRARRIECQTGAVELHHLRCFVSVAEERHFGRAAQRLHLSPAPVSRAVRALESELGVALFIRGHHNVRLTAAGSALRERAAEILRHADSLSDYARSFRHRASAITIGAFHLSPPAVLDRTVVALRNLTMWDVKIELVEPGQLPRRLAAGTLDFALLNPTPDCDHLPHQPIAVLDYVLVMRGDDPLAACQHVDWADISRRDVTLPPDTPFPSVLNDLHDFMVCHGVTQFDRIDSLDVAAMASRIRTYRSVIPSLSLEAGGPWRVFDDPAFAVRRFRQPPPPYVLSLAWSPDTPQRTGIDPRDVLASVAEPGALTK